MAEGGDTESNLLSFGIDVIKLRNRTHAPIPNFIKNLSNEYVLALSLAASGDPVPTLRLWFCDLAGVKAEVLTEEVLSSVSLRMRVSRLRSRKLALLKGKKKEALENFLKAKFELPSTLMGAFPAASVLLMAAGAVSEATQHVVQFHTQSQNSLSLSHQLQNQLSSVSDQSAAVDTKLRVARHKLYLAKKPEKESKAALISARSTVRSLNLAQKQLRKQPTATARALKQRLVSTERKHSRYSSSWELHARSMLVQKKRLKHQISCLKSDLAEREGIITELNSMLSDAQSGSISTKEGQSYSDAAHLCMTKLQSHGVAQASVGKVMAAVVCSLIGKQLSHMPSRRTVARNLDTGLALCHSQLADQLKSTDSGRTLYTDETTKSKTKMQSFVVSGAGESALVLGIREMVDKSALNQISCFRELLEDVAKCGSEPGLVEKIIASIANMMSDRANTQVKFNDLFETWRSDCLFKVYENWPQLSAGQREQLARVNASFCSLHLLANYSDVCNQSLIELEKASQSAESS